MNVYAIFYSKNTERKLLKIFQYEFLNTFFVKSAKPIYSGTQVYK